jgi:hypothetical protein
LQRSTAVCAEANNTKSLAARMSELLLRRSASAERQCGVEEGQSGLGERCGRA